MTAELRVLVIGEPFEALMKILADAADLRCASGWRAVEDALETEEFDVVFCGRAASEDHWSSMLRQVLAIRPYIPVIVVSDTSQETGWMEALEAGAFDLLNGSNWEAGVLPVLEHAAATTEARRLHGLVDCSTGNAAARAVV